MFLYTLVNFIIIVVGNCNRENDFIKQKVETFSLLMKILEINFDPSLVRSIIFVQTKRNNIIDINIYDNNVFCKEKVKVKSNLFLVLMVELFQLDL